MAWKTTDTKKNIGVMSKQSTRSGPTSKYMQSSGPKQIAQFGKRVHVYTRGENIGRQRVAITDEIIGVS